ncbi:MAG: SMC-Scp complex subunit ScpB [Pseudomonadota bacterium]|nr:MAG: SMC-Scp complex subunit ScpB [Pseudomonadota bacterium]
MQQANTELKNLLEAALLAAGQPLTVEKMLAMFPQDSRPTRDEVKSALAALEKDYAKRGIELKQIDKAWRIQTRETYAPMIAQLVEERPPRYSRALLETLSIIAYKQPVTRGDIEGIRGVTVSSEIIKTLLEREWIREVGRKEVPGRPMLYGTTRGFLEYFNLASLENLPTLAQMREIAEIAAELGTAPGASEDASEAESDAPASPAAGDAVSEAAEAEPMVAMQAGPADNE